MSPFIRPPRRGKPGTITVQAGSLRVGVTSHETPLIYYLVGTDEAGKQHRVGAWARNRAGETVPTTGWARVEDADHALNTLRGNTISDSEGAA